jgi:hypothetical protein
LPAKDRWEEPEQRGTGDEAMKKSLYCLWIVVVLQGVLILGMLHWQIQTKKRLQTEELDAKALRVDRLAVSHISLSGANGLEVGSLSASGPVLELRAASPVRRRGDKTSREGEFGMTLGFPGGEPVFSMRAEEGEIRAALEGGCPSVMLWPHPDFPTGSRMTGSPEISCKNVDSSDGQEVVDWYIKLPGQQGWQYPLTKHQLDQRLGDMTPASAQEDSGETVKSIMLRKELPAFLPNLFRLWEKYPETLDVPPGEVPIRALWQVEGFGHMLLDSLERRPSVQTVRYLGQSIEIGKGAVGDKKLTDVLAALGTRSHLPPKVRETVATWRKKALERPALAPQKPPAF